MKKYDLTLVICVYNAEMFIQETLQSVMNQNFHDFDLLIINDNSTDNSIEKINNFFIKNPRNFKLINFDQNQGICYARHFAERYIKTKYLMFLDSDDILYTNAIYTMYNKIVSDESLMAVGCYLEYIDTNSNKIGGGIFLGAVTKEEFFQKAAKGKLIFMQPTAIYNRNLALSVGGYVIEGFPDGKPRYQDFCEDLDLWTRMSDLYIDHKAIVVIPKILCKYRKRDGLSSNHFNMMLKMRYTKCNLLRRRRGETELTFTDFYRTLSEKHLKQIKNEATSADALRNSVFYLNQKSIVKAVFCILKSIWYCPKYPIEKIRSNFKLSR